MGNDHGNGRLDLTFCWEILVKNPENLYVEILWDTNMAEIYGNIMGIEDPSAIKHGSEVPKLTSMIFPAINLHLIQGLSIASINIG